MNLLKLLWCLSFGGEKKNETKNTTPQKNRQISCQLHRFFLLSYSVICVKLLLMLFYHLLKVYFVTVYSQNNHQSFKITVSQKYFLCVCGLERLRNQEVSRPISS